VGKTTCAAAWALAHAEAGHGVLVLSTDPAHSLADAFEVPLGAKPRRVKSRAGRLDAAELDAAAAVSAWLRPRRPALARLLDGGTLLDREDIARILKLPLPGLDELAAFLALRPLERSGAFETVVLDTAPTGHTLRLLDLPRLVQAVADLLAAMHARHAMVARALGGHVGVDALVEELRRDAADVERRLHDPSRCAIRWVTLPEPVTIEETIDGLGWLRRGGFPVKEIVLNRLTPAPPERCAECVARRAQEAHAIQPLAGISAGLEVRMVPRHPGEPRGLRALRAIGAALQEPRRWSDLPRRPKPPSAALRARPTAAKAPAPAFQPGEHIRLLLFGGKGGVGKSTCAAAVALGAAKAQARRAIRLVSTDPAPSLGDVLQMEVGDQWQQVPGRWRLEVRELDAAALFEAQRRRYQETIGEVFDRLRGGSAFDAAADREVFERLFDLAPPGVDEIMALLEVIDLTRDAGDDLVIVDTAPTGHTVRLLALQPDVQQWVAVLMHLVIKYRLAARAETLAQDLLKLSRGLRAFRALLTDARRAQFVAVTRAAALPRLETARLMTTLRDMSVAAPTVILNAATTGSCRLCRASARAEQQEAVRLRRLCGRQCDIMHAPLALPAPRGVRALLEWAGTWTSTGARMKSL
jgi:arsenite/tail-anchored protein-transporting ATPase